MGGLHCTCIIGEGLQQLHGLLSNLQREMAAGQIADSNKEQMDSALHKSCLTQRHHRF